MIILFLVIPIPACLIDSAFDSSLLVSLPDHLPSTGVPNLDGSYINPCRCLFPVWICLLLLDCLPVYRTRLVNVYSSESTPVLSRAIEFCTTPTISNSTTTPRGTRKQGLYIHTGNR